MRGWIGRSAGDASQCGLAADFSIEQGTARSTSSPGTPNNPRHVEIDRPAASIQNPDRICEEPLSNQANRVNPVLRMRLLLIDGHYRLSPFRDSESFNSRGEPTNAIFGFTKTLRLMIKHLRPELGAVVWDEGVPERRVECSRLTRRPARDAAVDDSAARFHPKTDSSSVFGIFRCPIPRLTT